MSEHEKLIDINEAAEILKRSKRTVQYLAKEGKIPAMKVGEVWRFSPSILRHWIESHHAIQQEAK